jgi:putative transposase
LEQRISLYAQTGKGVGFIEQCRQLTDVRAELPEVAAVYRDIQTDVLKRLDKAFDAFFRRLKSGDAPGFPRFKGRDRYDIFECRPSTNLAFDIFSIRLLWTKKIISITLSVRVLFKRTGG